MTNTQVLNSSSFLDDRFIGKFPQKVDKKNRIFIPTKFKPLITEDEKIICISRPDENKVPSLDFFSITLFQKYVEEGRICPEIYCPMINELEVKLLKESIRLSLGKVVVEYIEINEDREILFLGRGHYFSIYSLENGEKAFKMITENYSTIVNSRLEKIPIF